MFAHLRSAGSVSCMRCTANGKAVARVQLLPGGRAHSSYLPSTRGGLVAHFAAASRVQTRSGVQARGPFQAQVLAWLFRRLEKEATARLLREEKPRTDNLPSASRKCKLFGHRLDCAQQVLEDLVAEGLLRFPKKCLCCRRGRYPRQVLYLPARQRADGQAVFSQGQYVLRCDCCGHRLHRGLGSVGQEVPVQDELASVGHLLLRVRPQHEPSPLSHDRGPPLSSRTTSLPCLSGLFLAESRRGWLCCIATFPASS